MPAVDTTPSAPASPPGRPAVSIVRGPSRTPQLPAASRTALQFSGEHVLDRRVLERHLRVQAFELRILGLELLHPLELRDRHPRVLRAPVEVGRTADAVLTRQLGNPDPGF